MIYLQDLPDDVLISVLAYVPLRDRSALCMASSRFKKIVESDEYWMRRLSNGLLEDAMKRLIHQDTGVDCRHGEMLFLSGAQTVVSGYQVITLGGSSAREMSVNGDLISEREAEATFARVQIFDGLKSKWRTGQEMSVGRMNFACTVIEDNIYVAGGTNLSNGELYKLSSAEVYSISRNEWRMLPPLQEICGGCYGFSINNKFHVLSTNGSLRSKAEFWNEDHWEAMPEPSSMFRHPFPYMWRASMSLHDLCFLKSTFYIAQNGNLNFYNGRTEEWNRIPYTLPTETGLPEVLWITVHREKVYALVREHVAWRAEGAKKTMAIVVFDPDTRQWEAVKQLRSSAASRYVHGFRVFSL